jgi:hypothetical protein
MAKVLFYHRTIYYARKKLQQKITGHQISAQHVFHVTEPRLKWARRRADSPRTPPAEETRSPPP